MSAEKKQIQTFTDEMELQFKQGGSRFNLFATLVDFVAYLRSKLASAITSLGTGTTSKIPKITADVDGNITSLSDSRFSDNGTVAELDAGVAGKMSSSTTNKVIGFYSQDSESQIYTDGDNASTFYGNRIHSSRQNAVTGKHFSFVSISGINDDTVGVFTGDTHGTKLVSSDITTTQLAKLNNLISGTFTTVDGKTITVTEGLITLIE